MCYAVSSNLHQNQFALGGQLDIDFVHRSVVVRRKENKQRQKVTKLLNEVHI